MMIGLIVNPDLSDFCVGATVTNYRMKLTFSQFKSSGDLCMLIELV